LIFKYIQSQDNTHITFDFNSTKVSSTFQPLISSTNKVSASYIIGLSVASTTSLSNMISMSPTIASGMTLDTYLQQKQNILTNAITTNGIQLMVGNTSLQTISLKNSTSIAQITGGNLYENQNGYLNILQSQDNSNIIFDFNSDKLVSNYQPLLSSTNKLNSDFVNVNGITLTNYFLGFQGLISNYNNTNSIKLMNGEKLKKSVKMVLLVMIFLIT
jgi:outer membrane protein OmpA-like peptidoglycan-associated protein